MNDKNSLVKRFASRFGVDANKLFDTLKATAFKQRDGSVPTNEQMMALLVVAEQYNLNPFTREIYAFPDNQGIIPVVGVDGWCRIINEHPKLDGIEFQYSEQSIQMEGAKVECPTWIECCLFRKDRAHPIRIKEFLDEVYRPPFVGQGKNGPYTITGPWQTHTKRQLRHKALIQASRVAFSFTGIYDPDEAERVGELSGEKVVLTTPVSNPESVEPTHEVLVIEHKELHPVLEKLIERAVSSNAWSAAHEYVNQRYSGSERNYAIQYLRDKELETMSPPEMNYEEVDIDGTDEFVQFDEDASVES